MDPHEAIINKRLEVTRRAQKLQWQAEEHGMSADFAEAFLAVRSLLILAPWQEHGLSTLNNAEIRLSQIELLLQQKMRAA